MHLRAATEAHTYQIVIQRNSAGDVSSLVDIVARFLAIYIKLSWASVENMRNVRQGRAAFTMFMLGHNIYALFLLRYHPLVF
jgi:hypothetical protein